MAALHIQLLGMLKFPVEKKRLKLQCIHIHKSVMIAAWVPEKERGKLGSAIFGGGQVSIASKIEHLNQKNNYTQFHP